MAEGFVDLSLPPDFDGTVRLFPLRDVVLFPGIVQAFNIFEPRYRKMICLLYTSPSPRDATLSRMPSSA